MDSNGASFDKARSCAICAQRKVRCDKKRPCSRCQRAGIQCISPSVDRRPRWVRNLDSQSAKDATTSTIPPASQPVAADRALARLRHLEGLVKELSGELEAARTGSTTGTSQNLQSVDVDRAGRLIVDDSDHVRYVSNGFWSRIDSELDKLKEETRKYRESGHEEIMMNAPTASLTSRPGLEPDRTPSDRISFLFKRDQGHTDDNTSQLFPMASQVPFLLEVYEERVHLALGLPHLPTFKKRLRQRQDPRAQQLSSSEEALIFSVYYATIGSMDDEEIRTSFNAPKMDLLLRYRTGLENSLAKADFLNDPSDVILQAMNIFLSLARRYESPNFVWMMAGLAIRMAHYLGMHRDGSNSKHITPFQLEIQRRIWSDLCALDLRVTEDQGTELGIPNGSYTTQRPLNINDADIWPDMKNSPLPRNEVTNITLLRLCHESAHTMQNMMAAESTQSEDDHNRWIRALQAKFDREYFSLMDPSQHLAYAAMSGIMRVNLARLTLLAYPPILYGAPGEALPVYTRNKLLVAAMEVAEHNHALNSDPSCRPWKWIYQTQQHWHAVVYMLIEICQRPWSSTVERAWVALQSPWLVPLRSRIDRGHSLWAPVRALMAKARRHRDSEISRLQNDPAAAAHVESEDRQSIPLPSSSTTFPQYFNEDVFRERWHQLIHSEQASIASRLFSNGTTSADDHIMSNAAGSVPSLASTSTAHDTPSSQVANQALPTTIHHNCATSLTPDPSTRLQVNSADYDNLDAFLNFDGDLTFLDDMNIDDPLDIDWDAWFESAKGVL